MDGFRKPSAPLPPPDPLFVLEQSERKQASEGQRAWHLHSAFRLCFVTIGTLAGADLSAVGGEPWIGGAVVTGLRLREALGDRGPGLGSSQHAPSSCRMGRKLGRQLEGLEPIQQKQFF